MEGQLVWKDEYNIGIDIIDKEHERLFKIINKLFRFTDEKSKSQWACQEGIKFFKDHAAKHFTEEEEYMEAVGYERLAAHRHIHQEFRERTLPALEAELEQTDYSADAVGHFLGVCAGWLIGHTMMEDRAIAGKSRSRWMELLSEKEQEEMKEVILQLMYDLFRLEASVISETYGGERFGKGIYHRLVYGTDQEEEKWEIFLVFEEKLLLNTVGKAMGIKTNKLNTILMNAARYTARQFAGCVKEHLPDMDGYELKEENLLTYEEFQDVFEHEKLQVSLLFDTGEGYFAYCVLARRSMKKAGAAPIGSDNALAEVEKYLMKREDHLKKESRLKKKVLVVDDSITIRQGIRKLLADDYDVALAPSGTAAIRCVILDRPDLVLLDYEMPVCDGRMTLEMIRADEEMKDIPVVFLTAVNDRANIEAVLKLKPAGYFLKPAVKDKLIGEIEKILNPA